MTVIIGRLPVYASRDSRTAYRRALQLYAARFVFAVAQAAAKFSSRWLNVYEVVKILLNYPSTNEFIDYTDRT